MLQPGELTWRDVTRNPARRVGVSCDSAEQECGDIAASHCDNVYIVVDAISEKDVPDVAAARSEPAHWLVQKGLVLLGRLDLRITDLARRRVGSQAALRFLDLIEDPSAPTLAQLHSAGTRANSAEWKALRAVRKSHNLVGFILGPSEFGVTVILNVHALELLLERGSLSDEMAHEPVKSSTVQRLKGLTDAYELGVEQLVRLFAATVRLFNASSELGNATWRCVGAWLGGGRASNEPDKRGRGRQLLVGLVLAVLAALGAYLRGFTPFN